MGVNKFTADEAAAPPPFKIDDSIRQLQSDKLKKLKAARNNAEVKTLLKDLESRARSGENLMPSIISAVEGNVTLGEIADVFRNVFGEFRG